MIDQRARYPLWVRGDLDGFFGLMVDNLVQVLLIIDLCRYLCGLPDGLIFDRVLPGVAISLLIGNVFYGFQAHWVARRTGNTTCTALPYGINTPTVIAYAYFIMAPVYRQSVDALGAEGAGRLAWQAGLLACMVSGVIEFLGAFVAERLRRVTPRAALLGVLAAVGITFIAADFAFRIYTRPLIGILPLAVLLLAYFARYRFPWRIPGGFLAIGLGTIVAWGATAHGWDAFGGVTMDGTALSAALQPEHVHFIKPQFAGGELWALLCAQPGLVLLYLTVSIPMGVINVLGSLQNIESAEAGGDRFPTAPSLAVNGLGSMVAGLFGSCFPTTIYIGHPGWKALGARAGYSIANGVFFTLIFLFGLGPFLRALIPIEAGAAIVVYIGIIITAQAFQATPRKHAPAVAVAIFPALAALIVVALGMYFDHPDVHTTLAAIYQHPSPSTAYLPGLITLTGANSGWIVVTLILSAVGVALIEHKYRVAAVWMAVAAVLTCGGAIHAFRLDGNLIREYFAWQTQALTPAADAMRPVVAYRAWPIAVGYALAALVFAWAGWRRSSAHEITEWDDPEPNEPQIVVSRTEENATPVTVASTRQE